MARTFGRRSRSKPSDRTRGASGSVARSGTGRALVLALWAILAACGTDIIPDPDPITEPEASLESIGVTSPVGPIIAVGRAVTLTAAATDSDGAPMSGVIFEWTSNDASVSVDNTGTATGSSAGRAMVTATAQGVSGSLALRTVNADLVGVTGTVSDALAEALRAGLGTATRGSIGNLITTCSDYAASGHVTNLDTCLTQALAVDGADGDERTRLAVHTLFLQHAQELLQLGG